MSGIAGWTDYSKRLTNDSDALKAMVKRLTRTAPESEGFWVSGHTLLGCGAPAGDGPGGGQPVICTRGDAIYVMVYSGELYNTEDILNELYARGRHPERRDEAHAILGAYIEWGVESLSMLNGSFAIAIRDVENDRLLLARDRLGLRPLFYRRSGASLIFASELKALFAHPDIRPELDAGGLAEVFAIGPARTPGVGVFAGISELRPGSYISVCPDGGHTKKYWSLASYPHEEDFKETVSSVRELVFDAAKRQIAGTGSAFLLSGGLDSSAICAIAAREMGTIKTYSLDYKDNDINFRANAFQPNTDAPWVRRAADFLKSEHTVCTIDTPELTDSLFSAVYARDLPGMADIDSSLLLFSRWLRERADVGITGECADEMFGGYPWFYSEREPDTFPWARRLSERVKAYSPTLLDMIKPEQYVAARYEEALSEVPRLESDSQGEAKARELSYLTITRWLPTLLDRQSAMSSAAGLTLRAPFSDFRILTYMWNVPWNMKYHQNREKGLLRNALRGVLPDDLLWRKKSPFPKTHNPNYILTLHALTQKMLDDASSPVLPFINKEYIKTLAASMTRDTDIPWFGQLMNAPQLLAYILQVNFWLREYKISVL